MSSVAKVQAMHCGGGGKPKAEVALDGQSATRNQEKEHEPSLVIQDSAVEWHCCSCATGRRGCHFYRWVGGKRVSEAQEKSCSGPAKSRTFCVRENAGSQARAHGSLSLQRRLLTQLFPKHIYMIADLIADMSPFSRTSALQPDVEAGQVGCRN